MNDNILSSKVAARRNTVKTVGESSEFWHGYKKRLEAVRVRFTGREAEYLDRVKSVLHEQIEAAHAILIREIGIDIKTDTQLWPAPSEVRQEKRAWLENVERYGRDFMEIGDSSPWINPGASTPLKRRGCAVPQRL